MTLVPVIPVVNRAPAGRQRVVAVVGVRSAAGSRPAARIAAQVPASANPPAASVGPSRPSVPAASRYTARPSGRRRPSQHLGRRQRQFLGPAAEAGVRREGDGGLAAPDQDRIFIHSPGLRSRRHLWHHRPAGWTPAGGPPRPLHRPGLRPAAGIQPEASGPRRRPLPAPGGCWRSGSSRSSRKAGCVGFRGFGSGAPDDGFEVLAERRSGRLSHRPAELSAARTSAALDESGTQGPEPMDARSSPITSEIVKFFTCAGSRAAASRPPAQRVKRLRIRFMAVISSPDPSSSRYSCGEVGRSEPGKRGADEAGCAPGEQHPDFVVRGCTAGHGLAQCARPPQRSPVPAAGGRPRRPASAGMGGGSRLGDHQQAAGRRDAAVARAPATAASAIGKRRFAEGEQMHRAAGSRRGVAGQRGSERRARGRRGDGGPVEVRQQRPRVRGRVGSAS